MPHALSTIARDLSWPESPRWHEGAIWFSDVHHFRVMKLRPGEPAAHVADAPGRPAGMGFMPDGRLLLATALDRKLWWVQADGRLDLACDMTALATGLLNDMVVDRAGRAWVGDTGFDLLKGEPERAGTLWTWAPGEAPRPAATDVLFPNGIAISEDGLTLYLAETFGSRITAFDIEAGGTLARRRVHAALQGRPDGLCLDEHGGLWVPLLWQQEFHRIDGQGRVTDRIVLDGERAISCVLAGDDRRELYLGMAAMDESDKAHIRREGRLARCVVDVAGAGVP